MTEDDASDAVIEKRSNKQILIPFFCSLCNKQTATLKGCPLTIFKHLCEKHNNLSTQELLSQTYNFIDEPPSTDDMDNEFKTEFKEENFEDDFVKTEQPEE